MCSVIHVNININQHQNHKGKENHIKMVQGQINHQLDAFLVTQMDLLLP